MVKKTADRNVTVSLNKGKYTVKLPLSVLKAINDNGYHLCVAASGKSVQVMNYVEGKMKYISTLAKFMDGASRHEYTVNPLTVTKRSVKAR